jgi:hypothetical protein
MCAHFTKCPNRPPAVPQVNSSDRRGKTREPSVDARQAGECRAVGAAAPDSRLTACGPTSPSAADTVRLALRRPGQRRRVGGCSCQTRHLPERTSVGGVCLRQPLLRGVCDGLAEPASRMRHQALTPETFAAPRPLIQPDAEPRVHLCQDRISLSASHSRIMRLFAVDLRGHCWIWVLVRYWLATALFDLLHGNRFPISPANCLTARHAKCREKASLHYPASCALSPRSPHFQNARPLRNGQPRPREGGTRDAGGGRGLESRSVVRSA